MRLTLLLRAGRKSPFNYYTRYLEHNRDERYRRIIYDPIRGRQVKMGQKFIYEEDRPYTEAFHEQQVRRKDKRPIYVEPLERWDFFKGDRLGLAASLTAVTSSTTTTRTIKDLHPYTKTLNRPLISRPYSTMTSTPSAPSAASAPCSATFSTSTSNPPPEVKEGVLLGLGNPLLDITIVANEEFLEKYKLEANNAIMAGDEYTPMFEEMTTKFQPQFGAGGATQNSIRVAQWLLQRPLATSYFGGVGVDENAKILLQRAQEAGVNIRYCESPRLPTGVCASVITGENRSLVAHLGAADFFTHGFMEAPENWELVEKADYFYIGGFVFPVCNQAIFDLAHHAADKNKTLAMNLSAKFLCKYFAQTTPESLDIMPYIDILFGNEIEAAEFCKLRGLETDGSLEQMAIATSNLPKKNTQRSRLVVFTQGKEPTVIAKDGDVKAYPVKRVEKELIRDTNGCGDAFVGGFLAMLVQGKSIDECVKCGKYAAREVIQHWGCSFPEKPDFKEEKE